MQPPGPVTRGSSWSAWSEYCRSALRATGVGISGRVLGGVIPARTAANILQLWGPIGLTYLATRGSPGAPVQVNALAGALRVRAATRDRDPELDR